MQNIISWHDLRHHTSLQEQKQTATAIFNGSIAAFVFFTLFIALTKLF